jgi:hypothetical protein
MKKFVFLFALSFCALTATFAQNQAAAVEATAKTKVKAHTKKVKVNADAKVATATKVVTTPVAAAVTTAATAATTTATNVAAAAKGPVMIFEQADKKINYGTIEQGGEPLRKFKFKNTGTEPLVITNAVGSCGCTVPEWPKKPIMPGESASIDVRYDTQRVGPFTKTVTLTTNESTTSQYLTITGEVKEKAKPTSVPAKEDNMLSPKSN